MNPFGNQPPSFPGQPSFPQTQPFGQPGVNPFTATMGNIMRARPMGGGGRAPKLQGGSHTLILKDYKGNNTEKMGFALEAEFSVLASSDVTIKSGDSRQWPWFIEAPGYARQYASDSSKEFISTVMRSVNLDELPKDAAGNLLNPVTNGHFYSTNEFGQVVVNAQGQPVPKTVHDVQSIGELLLFGFYKGVQIAADLVPAYNKQGAPITDKNGKQVYNANWKVALPNQSLADIAKAREIVNSIPVVPMAPPPQAAHAQPQQFGGYPQPAPQQQYAPQPQQAPQYPPQQQYAPQPQQAPQYPPQQAFTPPQPAPAPALPPAPQTGAPQAPNYTDMLAALRNKVQ